MLDLLFNVFSHFRVTDLVHVLLLVLVGNWDVATVLDQIVDLDFSEIVAFEAFY